MAQHGWQREMDEILGNRGSFPQHHFLQYPLGLGRHRGNITPSAKDFTSPVTSAEKGMPNAIGSATALTVSAYRSTSLATALDEKQREDERATILNTHAALKAKLEAMERSEQEKREGELGGSRVKKVSSLLALTIPEPLSSNLVEDGPVVRSPTKTKVNNIWQTTLQEEGRLGPLSPSSSSPTASEEVQSAVAAVPFCVSRWHNKKKLIIPIEQRIQQEVDERTDEASGMGDHVVDLAVAMQSAKKAVQEELEEKKIAKQLAAAQQQAALEAEEAERGRKLLEEKAAAMAQKKLRKETRAERMERIRMERELREMEHQEQQRLRMLERAAARLQMSVEALEADEALLSQVEHHQQHKSEEATGGRLVGGVYTTHESSSSMNTLDRDNEQQKDVEESDEPADCHQSTLNLKAHLFSGLHVTQQGVNREMEALAALESQQAKSNPADGIHWEGKDSDLPETAQKSENQEESSEDLDEDDFHSLKKKRKLRL